jgi:hypothetical protein
MQDKKAVEPKAVVQRTFQVAGKDILVRHWHNCEIFVYRVTEEDQKVLPQGISQLLLLNEAIDKSALTFKRTRDLDNFDILTCQSTSTAEIEAFLAVWFWNKFKRHTAIRVQNCQDITKETLEWTKGITDYQISSADLSSHPTLDSKEILEGLPKVFDRLNALLKEMNQHYDSQSGLTKHWNKDSEAWHLSKISSNTLFKPLQKDLLIT